MTYNNQGVLTRVVFFKTIKIRHKTSDKAYVLPISLLYKNIELCDLDKTDVTIATYLYKFSDSGMAERDIYKYFPILLVL